MTQEQVADRAVLAEYVARANELVGATGNGEAYPIEAFGVFAQAMGTSEDGTVSPEFQVMAWPLDVALADMAECTVIDGDGAQTLLAALADANQETLFSQDGATYGVWFRPLLPHEAGCEDLG